MNAALRAQKRKVKFQREPKWLLMKEMSSKSLSGRIEDLYLEYITGI